MKVFSLIIALVFGMSFAMNAQTDDVQTTEKEKTFQNAEGVEAVEQETENAEAEKDSKMAELKEAATEESEEVEDATKDAPAATEE